MSDRTRAIISNYSDLNKFNQCVDWDYGFRTFVRTDYTMTHPNHMGPLMNRPNHVYWKRKGFQYAIRVWPKAYMHPKALRND